MPDVKNASGYYALDDMDVIDLFIGSEGTLGVVTEMEIKLLQMPKSVWGLMSFFSDEDSAINFVRGIRGEQGVVPDVQIVDRPVAIEFFNHNALKLLRDQKKTNPAFSEVPEIPDSFHTGVYVEYHGDSDDIVGDMVVQASELLEACGGDEDSTWLAASPGEMERLQFFRHAVPEAVNLLIDKRRMTSPGLTKLGTDMAVPDDRLSYTISMYNRGLLEYKLESVMFGHIGNNHIHVNILPNSMEEYKLGKKLYLEWAHEVIGMGGTVSAEHGIGKLKTEMLGEMYGQEGIDGMRQVKKAFDPAGLLNIGNLF
jgi:D-lactate dehydrogenase (cytochrome)